MRSCWCIGGECSESGLLVYLKSRYFTVGGVSIIVVGVPATVVSVPVTAVGVTVLDA